jgi:hypothetical protein
MSTEGFSQAEIDLVSATTLKHFIDTDDYQQSIQAKPLVAKLEAKKKEFTAANDVLSYGIQLATGAGGTNDGLAGFSHDDTVGFYNPTNYTRAEYIWREHHLGSETTESEFKHQGILIDDDFHGTKRSPRAKEILKDLMSVKMDDFAEQYASSLNNLFWGDGTADTSALHGIRALILDVPTVGTVGGLNNATAGNERWRNRARTAAFAAAGSFDAEFGGDKVTSSTANGGALIEVLEQEHRQLRRYGGRPDCWFAGSDFLDALVKEQRANGTYSDKGFMGKQDPGFGGPDEDGAWFKGKYITYDPTLDDLSRSKFLYCFDSRHIQLRTLRGDWKRYRKPKRPHDQFVMRTSVLCTGQLCASQRNSSLVLEIN